MTATKAVPPLDYLKIITWNVAALRPAWRHGLPSVISHLAPDILCLQEAKMSPEAKPPIEKL
jgi:exonuclease III